MIEYVVVYPYPVESATWRLPLVLKIKPDYLKGMLNLPGGKINPGERPTEAAVRELKEETGLEPVHEYDPMAYCPAEHMGFIQGKNSNIYCVRVPISEKQELKPGADEKEEVAWYPMQSLLHIKNLMPNLRLTIPLMDNGAKNWRIIDFDDGWRTSKSHPVTLIFRGMDENPIRVYLNAMGHYKMEEEQ